MLTYVNTEYAVTPKSVNVRLCSRSLEYALRQATRTTGPPQARNVAHCAASTPTVFMKHLVRGTCRCKGLSGILLFPRGSPRFLTKCCRGVRTPAGPRESTQKRSPSRTLMASELRHSHLCGLHSWLLRQHLVSGETQMPAQQLSRKPFCQQVSRICFSRHLPDGQLILCYFLVRVPVCERDANIWNWRAHSRARACL